MEHNLKQKFTKAYANDFMTLDGYSFKKLAELKWVWFWSGNWPLLDATTERNRDFEIEFKKVAGIYPRITVDIFRGGLITAYHCQEEYNRMAKFLYRKFEDEPKFILKSLADYEQKTNRDITTLEQLAKRDFHVCSNAELIKIFNTARKHFVYNSAIDHWAWYIEKFFTPKLEKYLIRRLAELGKNDFVPEYLSTLVSPTKPSRIYEERIAFFQIVKQTRNIRGFVTAAKNYPRTKKLAERFPKVGLWVRKHFECYGWLPVLVNNPPTTERDIWEEIVSATKRSPSLELDVKRLGDNFDNGILQRKKRLINELKPDLATLYLIRTLERTAFVRTEDNAVMSRSAYLIIPLYKEIARRLDISYYELKELISEEVVRALRISSDVQKLIGSRYKLSGFLVFKGRRFILDGNEANKLKLIIESSINQSKKKTKKTLKIFKGNPASLGRVRGRVFLALSSKDCNVMKKGDILIAPATSADFVPAMRKAAAIVTEFGGLTSHAAVVSREFNIPCVVGVENITNFLKSGDVVEIDASKGIVKIVE